MSTNISGNHGVDQKSTALPDKHDRKSEKISNHAERYYTDKSTNDVKKSVMFYLQKKAFPILPDKSRCVVPYGYTIRSAPGDGLCFIHSLVRTIALIKFTEDPQNGKPLSEWLDILKDILFRGLGKLLHGLEDINIVATPNKPVHEFITFNSLTFTIISENVIAFMLKTWGDPAFHKVPSGCKYLLPTMMVFQIHNCLSIGKDNTVWAIDGIACNFVMSILGCPSVYVYQFQSNPANRRSNFEAGNLTQILGASGEYLGFHIKMDKILHPIPLEGSTAIFTETGGHYDHFMCKVEGIPYAPHCNDLQPFSLGPSKVDMSVYDVRPVPKDSQAPIQ